MSAKYGKLQQNTEYQPSESSHNDSNDKLLTESDSSCERRPSRSSLRHNLFLTTAFLASTTTAAMGGMWAGRTLFPASPNSAFRAIQQYSPILNEVEMTVHTQRFDGSLLKLNKFRQDAGPEVDAAWRSLGVDYRSLTIPESEAEKSGLLADQVKINQKYGGGYPANVEGLHHLHCLNLLRQTLYFNYEHYLALGQGPFANNGTILKAHTTHCLDILRQQLMCVVDTAVLGQVWWNRQAPEAYVDFNTRHQCRDFDAVRRWAEERQISERVPDDFLEPPKWGDTVYESLP